MNQIRKITKMMKGIRKLHTQIEGQKELRQVTNVYFFGICRSHKFIGKI